MMITITLKIFHNGLLLPDEEEQRDSREEGRSSLRVSVSSAGNTTQWRKESVTIIESQEPMEEDNEVSMEPKEE